MKIRNYIIWCLVACVLGLPGYIVMRQYLDISLFAYGILIASIAGFTIFYNVGIDSMDDSNR